MFLIRRLTTKDCGGVFGWFVCVRALYFYFAGLVGRRCFYYRCLESVHHT